MSSYKKFQYFDPAQVESDQKDLIISQLKAELFELRQNEKDYNELHTKLNNLEHRYNLLQEEKILNEREFKNRHDHNTKTITNLKGDIDSLKSELNILNSDIQELRLENHGINEIINSRSAEIARLKGEISDVFDNNNRLSLEKRELEAQQSRLRNDNKSHTSELDELNHRIAELNERRNKNERLIKELEIERDKVERQNHELVKQAENLRADIRNKNEAIRYSENVLADNRKQIIALEADLNDLRRILEKTKNDISNTQKGQQHEYQKNLEASSMINQFEARIREREDEIAVLRQRYEEVKRDHLKLMDNNDDLAHDVEATARHLEMLTGQNADLIAELERFNEQDERVRAILDRKDRVHDVKLRTEGKLRQSQSIMHSSIRSPTKKRDEQ